MKQAVISMGVVGMIVLTLQSTLSTPLAWSVSPQTRAVPTKTTSAKPNTAKTNTTKPTPIQASTQTGQTRTFTSQEALEQYNQFVETINTGIQLSNQQQFAEAIPYFQKAIALNKTEPTAPLTLLYCYLKTQQWDALKALLPQVKTIPNMDGSPTFFEAMLTLETAQTQFNLKNWTGAQAAYQLAKQQIEALQPSDRYYKSGQQALPIIDQNITASLQNAQIQAKHNQAIATMVMEETLARMGKKGQPVRRDFIWNAAFYPVRYYVADGSTVPSWKPEWQTLVPKAFTEWEQKTNGRIRFQPVNQIDDADITVAWVQRITEDSRKEGGTLEAEEMEKVGITLHQSVDDNIITVDIQLETEHHKPNRPKEVGDAELYATILHEIGHALGIGIHSANPNDLMSPIQPNDQSILANGLTSGDVSLFNQRYLATNTSQFITNPTNASRGKRLAAYTLFEQANTLMDKRKYKKAIPILEQALAIVPNQTSYTHNLLVCYVAKRKVKPMEAFVSQLVAKDPNSPTTNIGQGMLLSAKATKAFRRHDWDEAMQLWGQSMWWFGKISPNSPYQHEFAQRSMSVSKENIGIAQSNKSMEAGMWAFQSNSFGRGFRPGF